MQYRQWLIRVKAKSDKKGIKFPTISATTYKRRDSKLKKAGLLDWERGWLVAHRLDSEGMRFMLDRRREHYLKSNEQKISPQEYRKRIGDWYNKQGWFFLDGTKNPFKMLEFFRDKAYADVTPTPKVPKKVKDFKAYKKRSQDKESRR